MDLLGSTRTCSSLKAKLALSELLRLAAPARPPARPPAPSADAPAPVELSFQERYGELTGHLWLEGGHVLAGFKSGQVCVCVAAACLREGCLWSVVSGRSGAQRLLGCKGLGEAWALHCACPTPPSPPFLLLWWDGACVLSFAPAIFLHLQVKL